MRRSIVLLSALVLFSANQARAGNIRYSVTDLGQGDASGINDSGQVVGQSSNGGFLWTDGSTQRIGQVPVGINDNGQVVGYTDTSFPHACLYSNGSWQDLGTLGTGAQSWGAGINNSGQVVGESYTNDGGWAHAFLYSNGTMQDLGTLPGSAGASAAAGINNSGQVVGWAVKVYYNAFLYSNGTMQDLGTLTGGGNSYAVGINNDGQVAGYGSTASGFWHAFLYSDHTMQDLGTLGGLSVHSYATGLNDSGQVVGESWTAPNTNPHAFLWSNGSMQDLNSLIDPFSGWTLEEATAINDRGQIVGYGTTATSGKEAFLLTPTPEPSTLALFGAGTIVLIGWAWRRRRVARTAKSAAFDQQDAPAILSFPSHSSAANTARRAA